MIYIAFECTVDSGRDMTYILLLFFGGKGRKSGLSGLPQSMRPFTVDATWLMCVMPSCLLQTGDQETDIGRWSADSSPIKPIQL